MKTDRFEELLRKKLENYTPDYREQDLDRMFSNIQRHTAPSFWSQYGKMFSNTVVGLTTAGLIFTILYQYNQNQKLNEQITLLQKAVPTKEIVKETITKIDTVYLTKYISLESGEQKAEVRERTKDKGKAGVEGDKSEYFVEKQDELDGKVENSSKNVIPILKENDYITNKKSQNPIREKQEKEDFVSQKNENIVFPKSNNNQKEVLTEKIHSESSIVSEPSEDVALRSLDRDAKSSQGRTFISDEQKNEQAKIVLNPMTIKSLSEYSSNFDLSNFKIKYRYRSSAAAPTKRPRYDYKFPDISLKNMRYRVGSSLIGSPNKKGFGLNNELMFNKNWSLNLGIVFEGMGEEEFKNDKYYDYKYGKNGTYEKPFRGQKDKKDFKDVNLTPFQPAEEISDIHLRNEIAYFPISVNYRTAIKKDFKLMFSFGTEIDFYVKEKVSFDFFLPNPIIPQMVEEFKTTKYNYLQPTAFNNLFFSTGLEKQFGKYVFQLSPYIIGRLKTLQYRPQKFDYGFRLNALYQFGKKK